MEKAKIMIVEDEAIVSEDIRTTLVDYGYDVCGMAETGEEAIRKIEKNIPDLVIMDIVLTGEMDGIATADEIHSRFDIPVIYLTAHASKGYLLRAKLTEPFGYLTKPVVYKELHSNIEMALYKHQIEKELKDKNTQLRRIMESTTDTIISMIKSKNPLIDKHQSRVAELSRTIAEEMGLPDHQIDGTYLAAKVHDIGKGALPYYIFDKHTPLSESECKLYKSHPKESFDLLKNIEFFWPIAEIVFRAHENMDGTGYPSGFKGKEILLEAKIIKVASLIDTWVHSRVDWQKISIDEALDKIKQNRGIRYDSDVVDACLKVFKEGKFKFED